MPVVPRFAVLFVFALPGCQKYSFEFPDPAATTTSVGGTASLEVGGAAGESASAGGAGGITGGASSTAAGGSATDHLYDTGAEDCTNGVDDDADGAADCEDEKCGPYFACVPTVPAGWQGPVALWEGEGDAPSCNAAGYYPVGQGSLPTRLLEPAEESVCPECSCTPVADAGCNGASVAYYASEDCSGAAVTVTASDSCSEVTVATAALSARLTAPPATGACVPVETGAGTSPPVALAAARSCGEPALGALGCSDDALCLARPLLPFLSSVCIFREGALDCPTEFPDRRETFFRLNSDGRTCRPCRCGVPTCVGAVSDATDDAGCSNSTRLSPGDCTSLAGDEDESRFVQYDAGAGATCQPGLTGPVGEYTLEDPITFCCYSL